MNRILSAALAVLVIGSGSAAAVAVRIVDDTVPCAVPDPNRVRTTRWADVREVADLGRYREIHWQTRVPPTSCPGTEAYEYQAVVRLRPADAHRLSKAIAMTAARRAGARRDRVVRDAADPDPAPRVWPGLDGFVHVDARWVHDVYYDTRHQAGRWRSVYVDRQHAIAVFTLNDDEDQRAMNRGDWTDPTGD